MPSVNGPFRRGCRVKIAFSSLNPFELAGATESLQRETRSKHFNDDASMSDPEFKNEKIGPNSIHRADRVTVLVSFIVA